MATTKSITKLASTPTTASPTTAPDPLPVTASVKPAAKPKKPALKQAKLSVKKVSPASTSVPKKPIVKPAPEVAKKFKKPKLVRDSFTIPKDEYAALDLLKSRAINLAHPAKKSELLRAGILVLVAMDDAKLLASLKAVTVIKTGRPKN